MITGVSRIAPISASRRLDAFGLVFRIAVGFFAELLELVEFSRDLQLACLGFGGERGSLADEPGHLEGIGIGNARSGDDPHLGEAFTVADRGSGVRECLFRELVDERAVPPEFGALVSVEISVDFATRSEIGIPTDEHGLRIAALVGAARDCPADLAGIVAIIAAVHLSEDLGLPISVSRMRIGLGHIDRDRAFAKGLEDRFRQVGQAEATEDEAFGLAEALGDIRSRLLFTFDDRLEGSALVGGIHRED